VNLYSALSKSGGSTKRLEVVMCFNFVKMTDIVMCSHNWSYTNS